MKKVYVVTEGEYSDYHIEAIFFTEEKAQAYANKPDPNEYGETNKVTEYVLDAPEHEWIQTIVRMKQDGTVEQTWQDKTVKPSGFNCFDIAKGLVWSVKTEDITKAVKVVNEKRAQIIALNIWGDEAKVAERFGREWP